MVSVSSTGIRTGMTEHADRNDLGHEPGEPRDRDFAPVNEGGDARGRSMAGEPAAPGEEGMERQEDEVSGTGVPGVTVGHPDALPPDDEGVRQSERQDASRESGEY